MGNITSFKKGFTPWNKGKTGVMPIPWNKGIPRLEETKQKIRETKRLRIKTYDIKKGKEHWNWRGNKVGYFGAHKWLLKTYGYPEVCEECHINPGKTKNGKSKLHWANMTGIYNRDKSNWKVLCISCHFRHDGLIKNFTNGKAVKK